MTAPLKSLPVLFMTIIAWPLSGTAQTVQYVTICNTNNTAPVDYPVQTNQLISFVGAYQVTSARGTLPNGRTVDIPAPSSSPFQIFTGLTTLTVRAGNVTEYAVFQVTTPGSANVISNYVPADAIVIPASITGNVQIILESSQDLLNWSAANPGTYGPSSATNRFFRVRALLN